jgi:dTDP-4-amino-4,6-dideoxygalactose transaminase
MTVSNRCEAEPIAFIDLKAQQVRIRDNVDAAIRRVLDHGAYIMGPEVEELEQRLQAFTGAKHAISCASGTDALLMALMAKRVGPGDAVICPAFTFTATPEAIALLGATPVFTDVDADTFNIDPAAIPATLRTARDLGLTPRAILAVDLFGQPADYDAILPLAEEAGLFVVCDAAQSFGASLNGRRVGQLGAVTATSFFPAKPLGCYGDGGALFTDDDELADALRSIRLHGKGGDKYDIVRIGINGRLDTIQAAVLIEKLAIFDDEVVRRQAVARRYEDALGVAVLTPRVVARARSVWAQYTIRVSEARRDAVVAALKARSIPTAVYYPRSLNEQSAYRHYPVAHTGVPVAECLAREVLSLPMHPYLTVDQQDRVIDATLSVLNGRRKGAGAA